MELTDKGLLEVDVVTKSEIGKYLRCLPIHSLSAALVALVLAKIC
jgi:hypothetical protein